MKVAKNKGKKAKNEVFEAIGGQKNRNHKL